MSITNIKALPKPLQRARAEAQRARQEAEEQTSKVKEEDAFDSAALEKEEKMRSLYNKALREHEELKKSRSQIQASYHSSERSFQDNMQDLEERMRGIGISASTDEQELKGKLKQVDQLHDVILNRIDALKLNVINVLGEQENNLIRAFRNRLKDVDNRYKAERAKNREGSKEWVEKHHKLIEEKAWYKDMANKLQNESRNLMKENNRYQRQLKTQDEDREFLIKQLVSVKKENARLKFSLDQATLSDLEKERIGLPVSSPNSRSTSRTSSFLPRATSPKTRMPISSKHSYRSGTRSALGHRSEMDIEKKLQRGEHVIKSLRKQLKKEKSNVANIGAKYEKELSNRSTLQNHLKKCIEDVREDIAERQTRERQRMTRQRQSVAVDPASIPLEAFSASDRINVMEWLLSQDHVIYLLYENLFPVSDQLFPPEPTD